MIKLNLKLILLFIFVLIVTSGNSQSDSIQLSNPSFEDYPKPSYAPRGWYDCGEVKFLLESPPDTHPIDGGEKVFGVTKSAYQGDTYLGMVVRENDSWESVAQRLRQSLHPDECYSFSIYMCTSEKYRSAIRGSDEEINFTTPVKLRIWGGNNYCKQTELLAESQLVENTDWEKFTFTFSPKTKVSFIVLEAFYQTPTVEVPNGNILLDNASPIISVKCEEVEK